MKYIILVSEVDAGSTRTGKRFYPFIFPEYVTHKTVATCMQRGLAGDHVLATPLSAGFCRVSSAGMIQVTEVGSESMGIQKDAFLNERDSEYLNMPRALQGFVFDKG